MDLCLARRQKHFAGYQFQCYCNRCVSGERDGSLNWPPSSPVACPHSTSALWTTHHSLSQRVSMGGRTSTSPVWNQRSLRIFSRPWTMWHPQSSMMDFLRYRWTSSIPPAAPSLFSAPLSLPGTHTHTHSLGQKEFCTDTLTLHFHSCLQEALTILAKLFALLEPMAVPFAPQLIKCECEHWIRVIPPCCASFHPQFTILTDLLSLQIFACWWTGTCIWASFPTPRSTLKRC